MSFHSRLRALPERFAAFIGTPVGIAIATILLVLAVGAVLTAWLACDGMRSIVKVNQIKQLKEAFAAMVFGTAVIYSGIALALCFVMAKLSRRIAQQKQAMDEMSRSMLHSLASPLSKIRNELDLLAAGVGNPEEVCQRGIKITDSLIDLVTLRTEIHQNRNHIELIKARDFDVVDAIKAQIARYELAGRSRGITVSFVLPSSPLVITAHPSKIVSLIDNLVSNAVKYNRENGSVTVAVSAEERKRKPLLKISVEDTGIGIAAEDQPRIYEEFFRAGNGIKADGSGMGLPLVQSIVMFYEGTVECKSALGVGTKFTVTLPVGKKAP